MEKIPDDWYDFLSGKGETAAQIASYLTDASKALSDANKEIADLKRQLEKYETNRYDPDQDREDDPRNNQTFGGKY